MPAPKGHPPYAGCEKGGRKPLHSTEDIERFADELLIWIQDESKFWIKDFFLEKNMDPDFIHIFAEKNEKFAGARKIAKSMQESRIFKGSMKDTFNASMSKFALTVNHGWVDKVEQKISGDTTNPLHFLIETVDGNTKDLVNEQE